MQYLIASGHRKRTTAIEKNIKTLQPDSTLYSGRIEVTYIYVLMGSRKIYLPQYIPFHTP